MSVDIPYINWQKERLQSDPDGTALIWRDTLYTRGQLLNEVNRSLEALSGGNIEPGCIVAVVGDYSPSSIARFLALIERNCIVLPLMPTSPGWEKQVFRIAQVSQCLREGNESVTKIDIDHSEPTHPLVAELRKRQHAGLVLFSSGSSGQPKAILHDLEALLSPMRTDGRMMKALSFLLFDHIGGFQTLFHTLAHLGCLVVPQNRSASEVCRTIALHQVELLPTSPTFLNLLLLEEAHKIHDLSSLRLVTYGTEAMPERTLKKAISAMPLAKFKQTYGSSELGILRSRSAANDSLLVQVGGQGHEVKIVDGRLFIRASGAMMGYLNAESPFDEQGWFDTGDAVVEEGEYCRIIGRESDIINVGGQKVFPIEVEEVIAELPEVDQVTVMGETHLLLGQTVVAEVQTKTSLTNLEIKKRIQAHCRDRLQPFMIPSKVRKVAQTGVTERFKKVRANPHS
ncbi:MAG: fatty acid--CoA ligase family protein [Verrucomicrobia bacterium]|nr:fatty acid--CoA ligase family protein [Verrucomicrobiota bacterium]